MTDTHSRTLSNIMFQHHLVGTFTPHSSELARNSYYRVSTLLVTKISRTFSGLSRTPEAFSRTLSYASNIQI